MNDNISPLIEKDRHIAFLNLKPPSYTVKNLEDAIWIFRNCPYVIDVICLLSDNTWYTVNSIHQATEVYKNEVEKKYTQEEIQQLFDTLYTKKETPFRHTTIVDIDIVKEEFKKLNCKVE